jgi:RimJ/RimL family protein N-acetyltransferase
MGRMQHTLALAGHGVCLVPLAPPQAEQLFPLIDAELWAGMAAGRPENTQGLAQLFAARLEDPEALPFAVMQDATGPLIGTTGLYELSPEHGRVEVGGTFFGRAHWGSGANEASKLLLLGYAFESLGVCRVGFRVDTRNGRSAAALLRMGACYEGTLRSHRAMQDGAAGGTRIDTAVFSVLDREWPEVRARLLDRLALRDEAPDAA